MSTNASTSETKAACRACGDQRLEVVLALGESPLANRYPRPTELDQPEPRQSLTLAVCPACALVQILETVAPEDLFSEYLYFSSYSDAMLKHAETVADELTTSLALGPSSLVVEVASNDGYQLQYFQKRGIPVLGIEPAQNIARVANQKGIDTRVAFFGQELAETLCAEGKAADVILANNVLAHVPDLNGVVRGFARLLKPKAVVIVEVPYVRHLVLRCEFDTIYHEHLCYFALTPIVRLFLRNGLGVFKVEEISLHGGSLRFFASQRGAYPLDASVTTLLSTEAKISLDEPRFYRGLAKKVSHLKTELVGLLTRLRGEGKRIAAYGAAAKGTTLLNTFGIGQDLIDFVVDRSPHKQGRVMPGVHIPIRHPAALLSQRPDYCLLLAWNFADEILEQQRAYRDTGGQFIIPVPKVRIV